MESIIVGDSECSFGAVLQIFRRHGPAFTIQLWLEFAADLEIPKDWIDHRKISILNGIINVKFALRETLEEWRSQKGKKATLECLVNALKQLQLTQIADNLEEEFKTMYVQRPGGLHTQICQKRICIVSTCDVQITTKKLRDTWKSKFCIGDSQAEVILGAQNSTTKYPTYILWTGFSVPDFLKNATTLLNDSRISGIVMVTNEEEKSSQNLIQEASMEGMAYIIRDTTNWSDLSKRFQEEILKREINFQGKLTEIQNISTKFGIAMDEVMVGSTLCDLISGKEVCIFNEKIPPRSPYYIQRRLIGRYNVNLSILKENCDDVFLLIGIERYKLLTLLPENTITGTTHEYLQTNHNYKPARHMTLSCKTDFDNIAEKTNHPVHLLKYAGSHLLWLRSAKSMDIVLQYISTHQTEFPEDKLMEIISDNNKSSSEHSYSAVVLSDTPGMGKSYLLQNIARQLCRAYPDRIVILLNLSEAANQIEQNEDSEELELKWLIKNSQNSFEVSILKTLAASSTPKIELLLDGYDEIIERNMDKVTKNLKSISNLPGIRIWITTRPQHLNQLENVFNVSGYNIAPFTEDDQINFLERFWNQQVDSLNSTKLKEFGKECLRVLNENTPEDQIEFSGIPLQCFLIAEVYQRQACDYSLEGNQVCEDNSDLTVASYTIVDLYENLVKKKLEIYEERYADPKSRILHEDMLDWHMVLALEVLFPELNLDECEYKSVLTSEVLKIGLLEHRIEYAQPQFIHRTFAEYFVALCFCKSLKPDDIRNVLRSFLFKYIFTVRTEHIYLSNDLHFKMPVQFPRFPCRLLVHVCENAVIVFLVDKIIVKPEFFGLSLPYVSWDWTKKLVEACTINNCFSLLQKFLSAKNINEYKSEILLNSNLLRLAVVRGSLDTVTFVFKTYANCFLNNVIHDELIPSYKSNKDSLLHIAANRGVYSIFEFLINQASLELRRETYSFDDLVLSCVVHTHGEPKTVNQRIQILRRLSQLDYNFIVRNLPNFDNIHKYKVHVDLINEILSLTVVTTDVSPCSFGTFLSSDKVFALLTKTSLYLSGEEYQQLLTHVLSVLEAKHTTVQPKWNEIFIKIQNLELLPVTIKTFVNLGVSFFTRSECMGHYIDWVEETELLTGFGVAILEGRSVRHLKSLIEHGANVKIRDIGRRSYLHLAACSDKYSETNVFEFLVGQGLSINSRTWMRETPLHFAAKYGKLEAAICLVNLGADVNARTLSFKTPLDFAKNEIENWSCFVNEDLIQYLEKI